jgi:hypothetical protein
MVDAGVGRDFGGRGIGPGLILVFLVGTPLVAMVEDCVQGDALSPGRHLEGLYT